MLRDEEKEKLEQSKKILEKFTTYSLEHKLFNIKHSDGLEEAIETILTAYEKEKEENVKLRLQDIPLIEGELKAYKDRVNELKQEKEYLNCIIESDKDNYINKEKIKERIKEYYEYDKRMQNKPDWHTTKYYEAKALEKLLEE